MKGKVGERVYINGLGPYRGRTGIVMSVHKRPLFKPSGPTHVVSLDAQYPSDPSEGSQVWAFDVKPLPRNAPPAPNGYRRVP